MKYTNVGNLTDLADGRIAEPGQSVELSADQADDPHNKRLIESGQLVALQEVKATKAAKEVNDGETRS